MAPKNTDPVRAAESNLGYLLGVTAAFHFMALLFVGMRMYARIIIVKAFGRDDVLILVSTVRNIPDLVLVDPFSDYRCAF